MEDDAYYNSLTYKILKSLNPDDFNGFHFCKYYDKLRWELVEIGNVLDGYDASDYMEIKDYIDEEYQNILNIIHKAYLERYIHID